MGDRRTHAGLSKRIIVSGAVLALFLTLMQISLFLAFGVPSDCPVPYPIIVSVVVLVTGLIPGLGTLAAVISVAMVLASPPSFLKLQYAPWLFLAVVLVAYQGTWGFVFIDQD